MKFNIYFSGLMLFLLPALSTAASWSPIIGIPEPSFGIEEEPPALPSPWTTEQPGFYYVCSNCAGSGNQSYGTPAAPRRNIPTGLSSGDVVVLAGSNNGASINFSCSVNSPCFLIADTSNPPTMTGYTTFGGNYYIVDGVHVGVPSNYSGSTMRLSGSHGAFRNGRVTGQLNNGGAGTGGDNIVIFNSEITDNGNVNASGDQDRHGLKVGGNNIWIIANEFARNSGDGIQVGGIGTRANVHHIYIGGNVSHGNKQTGFWVKEAQHVIVSQNLAYDHKPSGSSQGEGFGGQYDPQFVWFIFNESRNNTGGIGFKSSNNGNGDDFYIVGNFIHDNISSNFRSGDGWSIASIFSWNRASLTIVNNTIHANSGGIHLNGNTGSAAIYNNSITQMQASGAQAILVPDSRDIEVMEANALDGDQTIDQGVDPMSSNDPYAVFQAQYGIDIQVDFEGKNRPIRAWDIGAYESQSATGSRPRPPELSVE